MAQVAGAEEDQAGDRHGCGAADETCRGVNGLSTGYSAAWHFTPERSPPPQGEGEDSDNNRGMARATLPRPPISLSPPAETDKEGTVLCRWAPTLETVRRETLGESTATS